MLQGIEINNNSSSNSNLLKCSPAMQASRFNDFVYVSMITIRMLVNRRRFILPPRVRLDTMKT